MSDEDPDMDEIREDINPHRDRIHKYLTEALEKIQKQLDSSPNFRTTSLRIVGSFEHQKGHEVSFLVTAGRGSWYAQLGSVDQWLRGEKE